MAACRGGLFGWLWSLLGSTTPAYAGDGQPSAGRGWCDAFSTTPAYQPAPVETPPAPVPAPSPAPGGGNGVPHSVRILIERE